jgi:hypothetical protein
LIRDPEPANDLIAGSTRVRDHPAEWLTMMSDPLLAQSAVDRLTSTAHTLIIEGPSYRQRNRPRQPAGVDPNNETRHAH